MTIGHCLRSRLSWLRRDRVAEGAKCKTSDGKKKDPDQWVGALYVSEPGLNDDVPDLLGGLLPANRIFYSESLDIAVMHLNLPKNKMTGEPIRTPQLILRTRVPRQDDICVGLGYHKMNWTRMTEGSHTHEVVQSYSASRGTVKCIHHARRDSVMLHFPCFEIDCWFDGGMSGGPVISADSGDVVGVVCSTIDGQQISYASLAGPSLLLVMETKVGDERMEKKFLYDFVKGGAVATDQNFTVMKDVHNEKERELEIDFDGIRVTNRYKID